MPKLKEGDRVRVDVPDEEPKPIGTVDEVYETVEGECASIVWDDTGCCTDDVRAIDCEVIS